MAACTYCGSDLADYDPVSVSESRAGSPEQVGKFCNYACLTAWIDDEELVVDACCRIDP